ncbi:MAG: HTH domain-containing protein [Spirochaetales bacterium]|nr:HTH domain-containing protein [Spirochaetales bacterium]
MKVNNKEKILNILKKQTEPISGEYLSTILGISRTAIWKNINSLKNSGYNISTTTTGYLLNIQEDLLLPFEFDNDSNLYIYKENSDSTMRIAEELIKKGVASHGSTVVCETQDSGISKNGENFQSPKGGLYFSIVITPQTPTIYLNLYPMAAALAVNKGINQILNIPCNLVWPFENWSDNLKVSGVLHEFETKENKIKWMNIGIGIKNIDNLPRQKLLKQIRKIFFEYIENIDNVLEKYTNLLNISGYYKRFIVENIKIEGKVESIDLFGTITLNHMNQRCYAYIGNSSMEEK